jgi:hypothetical protein
MFLANSTKYSEAVQFISQSVPYILQSARQILNCYRSTFGCNGNRILCRRISFHSNEYALLLRILMTMHKALPSHYSIGLIFDEYINISSPLVYLTTFNLRHRLGLYNNTLCFSTLCKNPKGRGFETQ